MMAVWSEVLYSLVSQQERLDAEYFMPFLLELDRKLSDRHSVPLGDLAHILCSAFYPAATDLYDYGDTPFLRCVDIINHPILTPDQPYANIPADFIKDHSSVRCIKGGDIVISKVGSPCFAGLLDESMPLCAMTRTILGLRNIRTNLVDPRYLVIFLRSSIGFDQLMRERELTIQYQLTLDRTRKIRVYLPSMKEQRQIGDLLTQHIEQDSRSKALYAQAENLLLSELGLDDLDLSSTLFYERRFSETQEAARLDAEYFQPKYYRLMQKIDACPLRNYALADLIEPIRNGFDYREFGEDGLPYIRVGDVSNGGIDLENAKRIDVQWEEIKKGVRLKEGDVLLTRKGSYGNAAFVREGQAHGVISSEIMLLRILDSSILPEYLTVYLNCPAGFQQVQRFVHGVAFYSISQPDLASVRIIKPSERIQNRIAALVRQSDTARYESRRLLEDAKRMVEEAVLGGTC